MKILQTRIYDGPNQFSMFPVVRMVVDLRDLERYPSSYLSGFSDQLHALVPTLSEDECCTGGPGGVVCEGRADAWMGGIVLIFSEHPSRQWQIIRSFRSSTGVQSHFEAANSPHRPPPLATSLDSGVGGPQYRAQKRQAPIVVSNMRGRTAPLVAGQNQ